MLVTVLCSNSTVSTWQTILRTAQCSWPTTLRYYEPFLAEYPLLIQSQATIRKKYQQSETRVRLQKRDLQISHMPPSHPPVYPECPGLHGSGGGSSQGVPHCRSGELRPRCPSEGPGHFLLGYQTVLQEDPPSHAWNRCSWSSSCSQFWTTGENT